MNIDILSVYFQLASNTVAVLGLPLALFLFYHEKRKERRDREYGTYNALDDKYIRFLELCLERPELDVLEYAPPLEPNSDNTSHRHRKEQVLFLILISILERAYLMYKDQNTDIKRQQWTGWVEYIKDYCNKENFRRQWPQLGPQFDSGFVAFMEKLIKTQSN